MTRSGRAYKRIGAILVVAGVAGMTLSEVSVTIHSSINRWLMPANYTAFQPLGLLMTFVGAFLIWRGRQYAAKAAAERIVTDSNPDVLYLRAFRSDPSVKGFVLLSLRWGSGLETQEEQLADVLRPIGDLVAIGRPGEALPTPGAARIYASDEEWKKVVKGQMQAARLVIIRAGGSENLLWELKHAVETLNPQKVLILVLKMKAKDYESFRTEVNPVLSVSLPEGATFVQFKRVSGFIGFSADWKPSVFPIGVPYFRRDVYKPYRQLFKFALRPVFESFGLEWQPPPNVFWLNVIFNLVGLLLGILGFLNLIVKIWFKETNTLLGLSFVIVLIFTAILRLTMFAVQSQTRR
jgi:hypothetical protein